MRRSAAAGLSGSGFAIRDSASSCSASGASPRPSNAKVSGNGLPSVVCRVPRMSCQAYLPLPIVQAFGHRSRRRLAVAPPFGLGVPHEPCRRHDLLRPLLTSVPRSGHLAVPSVPNWNTAQISPGKSDRLPRTPAGSTALAFDGSGLCDSLPARPTKVASYPIPVRQVAVLLHTSFRRHLAVTPLRFANPSPPSGGIGDFHPQAIEHAGHTTNPLSREGRELGGRRVLGGPVRA
jgi:hypothetical protein